MEYFMHMDHERIGYITMGKWFESIDEEPSLLGEQIWRTLDALDDQDRIDFGEFCRVIGTFCFFGPDEVLRFTYQLCDKEKRGSLRSDELLELFSILHPIDTNGRVQRALREFDVKPGQFFTYKHFQRLHALYPNLLFPAYRLQHATRSTFLGEKYWEKKLRKYAKVRDEIRTEKINSDIVAQRRKRKADRVGKRRVAIRDARDKARDSTGIFSALHTTRYLGLKLQDRLHNMLL